MQMIQQELLGLARQTIADHAAEKMSQSIVLRSKNGKVYSFFATLEKLPTAEDQICSQFTEASDTAITHMAVMWENGQVDVPSHRLRSRLVALDAENQNALILLQGENGFSFRRLGTTL